MRIRTITQESNCKIPRKIITMEFPLGKVASPRPATLLKKHSILFTVVESRQYERLCMYLIQIYRACNLRRPERRKKHK